MSLQKQSTDAPISARYWTSGRLLKWRILKPHSVQISNIYSHVLFVAWPVKLANNTKISAFIYNNKNENTVTTQSCSANKHAITVPELSKNRADAASMGPVLTQLW